MGAGALLGVRLPDLAAAPLTIAGEPVEIVITPVSAHTVRVTVVGVDHGRAAPVSGDGSLVRDSWGPPAARFTSLDRAAHVTAGPLTVTLTPDPLTIEVARGGRAAQRLVIDRDTGAFTFQTGDGPVYGMGEGGAQFDRRGHADPMVSGSDGYELRTHGSRVPIPWLIGTAGWAMYVHRPYGTFDLTSSDARFGPRDARGPLPLDVFVVASSEPRVVMAEYALLTGHPEMPPRWAFGYQQSHRTITKPEDILGVARTFREKKLPCDTLIYLGTGFVSSGWNTANGSFQFNAAVFPDPAAMLREFHDLHFRVVLHAVILTDTLSGTVRDGCDLARYDASRAGCYWDAHRADFALGVDGWWPDEGDSLDPASRLTRIRMYWEGPQIDRPNQRPYALHRNGYAGMQRYAPFLWSGDVFSTWETLRTHVAIAINAGLTGIPYWGTDTGGFVPTKELTGELFVRWFQFSAFCPLFRSHGRTWHLRLPWGWNTGELGPNEVSGHYGANPDPSALHDARVEPICRTYLELRSRLMPYLYSAVREAHDTGLPIVRALWMHHPDDPAAVSRSDEYLWGGDMLVAPVLDAAATSRGVYLPRGDWYDYWTEERASGGREIDRAVDLATLPLYVRAGAVIPMGPVEQYTDEVAHAPLTLVVYPGTDGRCTVYEDDGETFEYRRGGWMGLEVEWRDAQRTLSLRLARGSRVLAQGGRRIVVRVVPGHATREVLFEGRPTVVRF